MSPHPDFSGCIKYTLLLASITALSKSLSILSIFDRNPSKTSLLSILLLDGYTLSVIASNPCFHFISQDETFSLSLEVDHGLIPLGQCCQALLSLPLSGGTMNPLPIGGGFVVVSWSMMPLFLSSWSCELTVMLVRFAPDCPSMLLCDGLGCATFRLAITILLLF